MVKQLYLHVQSCFLQPESTLICNLWLEKISCSASPALQLDRCCMCKKVLQRCIRTAQHSFGAGAPASSPTDRSHMISCLSRPPPETGSVSPPPPPPQQPVTPLPRCFSKLNTSSSSPSGEVLKIMHHLFLKGLCDRFSSPFSLVFFPHCLFFFLPLLLHQRINNQPHIKFCV